MNKTTYYVLGVMSGTSLDGVDLAYIKFTHHAGWEYQFLQCQTIPYNVFWKAELKTLIHTNKAAMDALNSAYTLYLAELINTFINKNRITNIDFISSHGHTAWHQPDSGVTLQIGNKPDLARITGHVVVCDFRVQDVALGGQGAPLVPIGDLLLFPDFDYCLNLGGFANLSTNYKGSRIAFDVCPVNIVLNHYVGRLGFDFDTDGQVAASGVVCETLLEELNNLAYYKHAHPKSLGLEWVQQVVLPLIDSFQLSTPDVLRTFVAHVAAQIAQVIKTGSVLVTGGGAYNSFLTACLKKQTAAKIVVPNTDVIEYKEALIFAFLGVLRVRNEVNCLASVTGAKHDHSSGIIYSHENY
ncbi:anhydro-N-acetylmuramic acid kinase [Bizionia sediminis]|uniref:Anhydro-N-acetylmuramic acid kinase n=1 Tax=Bizionia sediminis TaxID=1737064 RepID=A0ABW5KNK8_9FLAO